MASWVWLFALVLLIPSLTSCEDAPVAGGSEQATSEVGGSVSLTEVPAVIAVTPAPTSTVAPILISELQVATATPLSASPTAEAADIVVVPTAVLAVISSVNVTSLPSSTPTPEQLAVVAPSPTGSTATAAPTATPIVVSTSTPTPPASTVQGAAVALTPTATVTSTREPAAVQTVVPMVLQTSTPTPTATGAATAAATYPPLPSATAIPTATPTATATSTPTATSTATATHTATRTPVPEYCRIKGNINMESGVRVYHTPDSPWYDRTEIDTNKGERWFCTEQEAADAGWRAPNRTQTAPTATAEPDGPPVDCEAAVNINEAGVEQLEMLPGIGPVRAQAIVDYRNASGPFMRVEELDDVPGIGERTLEKIRPCITLE